MSLTDGLENAVQSIATWLLEAPVISQTVRLRIATAHWRSSIVPRLVPQERPGKARFVIVIGVRPGGAIHENWGKALRARMEAEGRPE